MDELIIIPNGNVTMPGSWSAKALIEEIVAAAPEGANSADIARVITAEELKTDPWRLPAARAERKLALVGKKNGTHKGGRRDQKFLEWDRAALIAWENGETPDAVKAAKQALRDLPPVIDAALASLEDTDAIEAYLPEELM